MLTLPPRHKWGFCSIFSCKVSKKINCLIIQSRIAYFLLLGGLWRSFEDTCQLSCKEKRLSKNYIPCLVLFHCILRSTLQKNVHLHLEKILLIEVYYVSMDSEPFFIFMIIVVPQWMLKNIFSYSCSSAEFLADSTYHYGITTSLRSFLLLLPTHIILHTFSSGLHTTKYYVLLHTRREASWVK